MFTCACGCGCLKKHYDEVGSLCVNCKGGVCDAEAVDDGVVYPVEGTKYIIREWDDSTNKVTVVKVAPLDVTYQYEDGLTHKVTPDYFAHSLNATGIR
jgi:hypothetical protein